MVKFDATHDYYADLEVTKDATSEDIKKQFRKLALKYHPDRNPGKELEYNSRFQAIQAAHEILIDPEQRRQYDASRLRPAMPERRGSTNRPTPTPPRGRGNPYPARSDFPPPRMRTNNTGASGAERYTNFAPPPSRPNSTQDARESTNAFKAWQHMRDAQKNQSNRQQGQESGDKYSRPQSQYGSPKYPPPKNTPQWANTASDDTRSRNSRTESEEFNQRTAYDETRRQRPPPPDRPMPPKAPPRPGFDPANASADEGPAPSHTHYNRAHPRSPPPPPPSQMPGAFPTPPPQTQYYPAQAPTARRPHPNLDHLRTEMQDPPFVEGSRVQTPYMSHSGERTYFNSEAFKTPASASTSHQDDSTSNVNEPRQPAGRRHSDNPSHNSATRSPKDGSARGGQSSRTFDGNTSSDSSSSASDLESGLSGDPITKSRPKAQPSASWTKRSANTFLPKAKSFEGSQTNGPQAGPASHGQKPGETTFTFNATPDPIPPRARSSMNIDTNFSTSNGPVPFSANKITSAHNPTKPHHPVPYIFQGQNTNTSEARPPTFDPSLPPFPPEQPLQSPASSNAASGGPFSADHWKSQMQGENWASQWAQGPPHSARTSPTRNGSATRKSRGTSRASPSDTATPLRQPGTPLPSAVEEEDSRRDYRQDNAADGGIDGDAMDIDPTPPSQSDTRPSTADESTSYPHPPMAPPPPPTQYQQPFAVPDGVSPSTRPDEPRRASYPTVIPSPPSGPPPTRSRAPTIDMNAFRHVPPFHTRPVSTGPGLGDLNDVADNLPFKSRAASSHPDKADAFPPPRPLPKVPTGPPAPQTLTEPAWNAHIKNMTLYINAWNKFNKEMADMLSAQALSQVEMEKGPSGGMVEAWVGAVGETGSLGGWDTYVGAQIEQQRIRAHWTLAFEKHRGTVDLHTALRQRVMERGL